MIKHTRTHTRTHALTHAQATVTEGDEVLSLDVGVVLVVDPDVLLFTAQLSLITLAQLRLSLLCAAERMFRVKTFTFVTLNFSQMSG